MKRILLIFCSTLILISCSPKQTNSKEGTTLYVVTINTPKPDSTQVKKLNQELPLVERMKGLPPAKNGEIRSVTADHFEISLNLLADGSGYLAQRNVTEPTSDIGNSKIEYITEDWCSNSPKTFKTAVEFLDFISARGYKLTSQTQTKNIRGIEYIFDKK